MREAKISSGEFAALLLVSSISFVGTVSGNALGGNYSDAVLAALFSSLVGWILLLPIVNFRREAKLNKLVASAYLAFFIYTAAWDISSVAYMMRNTVFNTMDSWLFCLIFLFATVYCAKLGLETIGRSAQIVLIVTAVCGVLMLIAAIKHLEFSNVRIPFFDGSGDFFDTCMRFVSGSMFLPQCYLILESVRSDGKKKLILSSAAIVLAGLITSSVIALVMLCIGNFALTQEFPVFTLASYLDLEPLQRLDVFLGIIIITTNLVKTSINVFLIRNCSRILSEKYYNVLLLSACISIIALSSFTSQKPGLQEVFYSPLVVTVLGVILGVLVPSISTAKKR